MEHLPLGGILNNLKPKIMDGDVIVLNLYTSKQDALLYFVW